MHLVKGLALPVGLQMLLAFLAKSSLVFQLAKHLVEGQEEVEALSALGYGTLEANSHMVKAVEDNAHANAGHAQKKCVLVSHTPRIQHHVNENDNVDHGDILDRQVWFFEQSQVIELCKNCVQLPINVAMEPANDSDLVNPLLTTRQLQVFVWFKNLVAYLANTH